jgi:shikimate kinase
MSKQLEHMSYRLHRTIVLVGMMGSGKTAIGRALAARLGVAFLDSDAEIEEAASASIAEIFARDGEVFFREREAEVIERLLSGPPVILSTGGGAFLTPMIREKIAQKAVSVWLDAPLDILWERVRHKDTRPLLRTANPYETLSEIYDQRVPIYQLAQMRVPIQHRYSIDDTTDVTCHVLESQSDILETL